MTLFRLSNVQLFPVYVMAKGHFRTFLKLERIIYFEEGNCESLTKVNDHLVCSSANLLLAAGDEIVSYSLFSIYQSRNKIHVR